LESSVFGTHCRVLVVDDFPAWRIRICSLLESMPELEVVGHAFDGLEAVQKAAELKPDLILLDIGLPSINGIEAASRMLEDGACRSKILFISENRDPDVVAEALACKGALGYLLKTDVHSNLLPAIAAIRRGENFMSPGLTRRFSRGLSCVI
jgi:DNA-binding NarL/FixJ family response regulator